MCLFAATLPGGVRAQEGEPVAPEETEAEVAVVEQAETPLPGPKYLGLRYDEDFSYLAGEAGSYKEDFADPVKYIRLDDDWSLTVGGSFRFRLEAETNRAFGATEPAQDTFVLHQYMLHADLKYRKAFRAFVQGIAAFDEDRDLALRGGDENRWDVHQAFFDLRVLGEELPLTLRFGRQELLYGKERLVSPLGWANVRRRFDAVKLFAHGDTWDVDLWYAKPVVVQRKQRDRYNEDVDFYGAYATYKGFDRHGLDLYFLALDDNGNAMNPNGRAGDREIYTLGSRFWGYTNAWDYETEIMGQWGHWAGDTVQAWNVSLYGGYTFGEFDCKPRIGAGFDWATGDDSPRDGSVGTFNQLFPLGHGHLGYLDLIGRQNVTSANFNLSAWAVPEKVKTQLTYHTFWLSEEKDALYNAGGGASRRDPGGNSGKEIGQELDLTVKWKLDDHSDLLFGYSHMWHADFIVDTGSSEDADLFYVQYGFKF